MAVRKQRTFRWAVRGSFAREPEPEREPERRGRGQRRVEDREEREAHREEREAHGKTREEKHKLRGAVEELRRTNRSLYKARPKRKDIGWRHVGYTLVGVAGCLLSVEPITSEVHALETRADWKYEGPQGYSAEGSLDLNWYSKEEIKTATTPPEVLAEAAKDLGEAANEKYEQIAAEADCRRQNYLSQFDTDTGKPVPNRGGCPTPDGAEAQD